MCFLYLNIKFPSKGLVNVVLSRIFGIGRRRASYISDLIGLMQNCDVSQINKYQFALLITLIKKYYGIDLILKRNRFNRLKRFLSVKSYNSLRIKSGLPIRGQKTHNNGRTAKTKQNNLVNV